MRSPEVDTARGALASEPVRYNQRQSTADGKSSQAVACCPRCTNLGISSMYDACCFGRKRSLELSETMCLHASRSCPFLLYDGTSCYTELWPWRCFFIPKGTCDPLVENARGHPRVDVLSCQECRHQLDIELRSLCMTTTRH